MSKRPSEYACRAGTKTAYWPGNGEAYLAEVGWYGKNSDRRLHPVGEKQANPWGLHDVHGNVDEWCEDKWHNSYDGAADDGRAWTASPEHGEADRVIRGGNFDSVAQYCRSAYRIRNKPSYRRPYLGFRVVLPIPDDES